MGGGVVFQFDFKYDMFFSKFSRNFPNDEFKILAQEEHAMYKPREVLSMVGEEMKCPNGCPTDILESDKHRGMQTFVHGELQLNCKFATFLALIKHSFGLVVGHNKPR